MNSLEKKLPLRLQRLCDPVWGYNYSSFNEDKCFELKTYYNCCRVEINGYDMNFDGYSTTLNLFRKKMIELKKMTYDPELPKPEYKMLNGANLIELGWFWNNFYEGNSWCELTGKENRKYLSKNEILEHKNKGTWKSKTYQEKRPKKGMATKYLKGFMDILLRNNKINLNKDYIALMTRDFPQDGLIKFYNGFGFETINVLPSCKNEIMYVKFDKFYARLDERIEKGNKLRRETLNAKKKNKKILNTQVAISQLQGELKNIVSQ